LGAMVMPLLCAQPAESSVNKFKIFIWTMNVCTIIENPILWAQFSCDCLNFFFPNYK
jgi:hypothetical protein